MMGHHSELIECFAQQFARALGESAPPGRMRIASRTASPTEMPFALAPHGRADGGGVAHRKPRCRQLEFKPVSLELGAFVRRLVDEVLSATDRRCPIEFLLAQMPAKVQADERLLRHIFTNVLTNAVKYSDAGQVVKFEIERTRADIVFTIRDQGIGIPEADQEWLFNAFHRGRNVGDRPGTGLGLVIVKRCVDLHGGKINVDSELGEGTSVTVRLPIFSQEFPAAGN